IRSIKWSCVRKQDQGPENSGIRCSRNLLRHSYTPLGFGHNWSSRSTESGDERTCRGVELWSSKTLKSLVLPGGAVLLAADVVFREAFGPIPPPIIHFCFYAISVAGIFLAW